MQIRNLTRFQGFIDALHASNAEPATSEGASGPAFPSRAPVFVPGCSQGAHLLCPVLDFADLVRLKARPECVTPEKLQAYLRRNRSLTEHPTVGADDLSYYDATMEMAPTSETFPESMNAEATARDLKPHPSVEINGFWSAATVFSVVLNLVLGFALWRLKRDRSTQYSPINNGRKDDDYMIDSALDISSHNDNDVGASFDGLDFDERQAKFQMKRLS